MNSQHPEEHRSWIRRMLLEDYDVADATVHYATEGAIDTEDLWWLYEQHHVMAPASAWLLARMWQSDDADHLEEVNSPQFWWWLDEGPTAAKWNDHPREP